MKIILLVLFLVSATYVPQILGSGEVRYTMRSPYALLMGDAYTARADDEYTLFYNPAALAKNRGLEFYILNPDFGVTNLLSDLDRFSNMPDDASGITDRLTGFPIYVHLGAIPTIKFGPFGLSLFANLTSSLVVRNSTHPILDIDQRYDRGFAFGYAHTFGGQSFFNKGQTAEGLRTSVGVSVKHMNRQGIKEQFDIFGTGLLSSINNGETSDYDALKNTLGYSVGDAWGWDVGFEQSYSSGPTELTWALAIHDINDTNFTKTEGTSTIPVQDMIVSTGVSWRFKMAYLDFSANMDLHPLLSDIAFMRKTHFGFDLGIPMIRAMLGFNEGYISYGVRTRIWPFELTAGFYGVELGNEYRQEQGKRIIIYLSLFDFSFDA